MDEKENRRISAETALRSALGGREEQQDRAQICAGRDSLFAVVCDGMGGGQHGALASEAAVEAAVTCWSRPSDAAVPQRLQQVLQESNEAVVDRIGLQKGGTTLVAAAVSEGLLYWVSAGDSRLYIVRNGEMLQATRDHDYHLRLTELQKTGRITAEHLEQERKKGSALISYLGMEQVLLYDLTEQGLPLQPEDRILLTTDGLYGAVEERELQRLLCGEEPADRLADRLLDQLDVSLDRTLQDNSTFVLIKINHGGMCLV